MKLSQTVYMTRINAPVSNVRQSWDGKSESKIVMKAWTKDTVHNRENKTYRVRISKNGAHNSDTYGYRERIKSIESVKNGTKGFIILSKNTTDTFGEIDTNTPLYVIDSIVTNEDDDQIAICTRAMKFKEVSEI